MEQPDECFMEQFLVCHSVQRASLNLHLSVLPDLQLQPDQGLQHQLGVKLLQSHLPELKQVLVQSLSLVQVLNHLLPLELILEVLHDLRL
jgi:hypothetical protein